MLATHPMYGRYVEFSKRVPRYVDGHPSTKARSKFTLCKTGNLLTDDRDCARFRATPKGYRLLEPVSSSGMKPFAKELNLGSA